jgi:hypothetical protein
MDEYIPLHLTFLVHKLKDVPERRFQPAWFQYIKKRAAVVFSQYGGLSHPIDASSYLFPISLVESISSQWFENMARRAEAMEVE